MIDKKKLIAIGVAVVVVIVALIIALIVAISGGRDNSTTPSNSSSTPATAAPSSSDSSSPTPSSIPSDIAAANNLKETASTAALNVANWNGGDSDGQRHLVYKQAGLTTKLVKSFVPVWSKVFDTKKVMHYNGADGLPIISASVTNQGGQTAVTDVSGTPRHHQFTYRVQLDYTATWDQKTGSDDYQQTGTYTYRVTVDEATKKTVAIQQPTTSDIAFRLK